MNSSEKVSIYIPTRNRARLLARAVDSVLMQRHQNIELIIVDDGSTDSTGEYLKKISEKHPNVVIIKNKDAIGAPASRNKAIFVASGSFITGLDDDDFLESAHIEKCLKGYAEDYSCIFVRPLYLNDLIFQPIATLTGNIGPHDIIFFNTIGNQVFTKTKKLKEIGGFDTEMPAAQDYETWIRLLNEFGPAKRIYAKTYIIDDSHSFKRISSSKEAKILGLNKIYHKHRDTMGFWGRASMKLRVNLMSEDSLKSLFNVGVFDLRNARYIMSWLKHRVIFNRKNKSIA